MSGHIGATGGLIVGGLLTAAKTINAYRREPDTTLDIFQSCFTGWSMDREDWELPRMVFTVPVLIGGGITWVAKKTGYNKDTPKGWNL